MCQWCLLEPGSRYIHVCNCQRRRIKCLQGFDLKNTLLQNSPLWCHKGTQITLSCWWHNHCRKQVLASPLRRHCFESLSRMLTICYSFNSRPESCKHRAKLAIFWRVSGSRNKYASWTAVWDDQSNLREGCFNQAMSTTGIKCRLTKGWVLK